jgi:hypothetical protein
MFILLNLLSEEFARGHRSPFSRSFEVEAFSNNHQNGKGELAVGQLTGPARSASRWMALSNFSTITSPRSSKWSGILCAASALASDHYELRRFP